MTTELSCVTSLTERIPPVLSLEEVLAQARRNSLTRDNPRLADLPAFFTQFRDHQRVAIREILTAYEEGAQCVVLDAPTGSGKTIIGEAIRRLLPGNRQTTYICSSKALQSQFLKDYPYAKVLQGRSNYATQLYPERFTAKDSLSCADCTKSPGADGTCLWCDDVSRCPYVEAKSAALSGDLAVLNTSYFLSECNGPGRFSRGGLVIADEADCLEGELLKHVQVSLSETRLKTYQLSPPSKMTVASSWIEWAEEAQEKIKSHRPKLTGDALRDQRAASRHSRLLAQMRELSRGLAEERYIYTGDREKVEFKPVTVRELGEDKLWQHGDKWLLMSASVISADEMLESLGWDEEKSWRLVKVPSTFDPAKRKVIVWPVADMGFKNKETSWPKMTAAVKEIVERHPEDRVLIHCVSYDLAREIEKGLRGGGRPVIAYTNTFTKDAAIAKYRATERAILVAPSLDRGIDLPGDACRVQIITKVPYGYLKDRQVSARLHSKGGRIWYAVQAIRTMIQMTGRAVRSEEDWATSYILDSQFMTNLWTNHRTLVPEWWKQALVWKTKGL